METELTPAEFYRLRDDRTNRVVKGRDYHALHVRVVADRQTTRSYNGQVQLLLAANLMARWCRQVEYGFPDAPLVPLLRRPEQTTLYGRLLSEVREADPFGDFSFRETPSPTVEYTLRVGSYSGSVGGEDIDFTVDTDGWRAYAGSGSRSFDIVARQSNPGGAAFAACIGVADAFKVAVGLGAHARVKNTAISLFDFSVGGPNTSGPSPGVPAAVDLGTTQIVGVGSVGSAVIYLLGMVPLEGNVDLVDLDQVEYVNLNRSPLFGISDVGKPKVAVAEEYLNGALPTAAFFGRYVQYIEQHGRAPGSVDLVLPLANEYGVRASIENNFPPLQIYGTTASDWGINYHRHIPLQEDCSLCRFPVTGEEAAMICAEASLETAEEEQVDAALPFLSAAAAALIVGDLLKLHLPEYPTTPNFGFFDFKGNLEFVNAFDKSPKKECACRSRSQRVHERAIASTMFSGF